MINTMPCQKPYESLLGALTKKQAENLEFVYNRENEVIMYTAKGLSSEQIGQKIGKSGRTVEQIFYKLYVKYNCNTKAALVYRFIQLGRLPISES
jgi:DNA-binding CsgD family transcriptional regulator